jgi:hypothetical protein
MEDKTNTMADVLSRSVIAVQATHVSGEDKSRAQSIADLFAWCGDGVITPNQLHAYLRPDTSAPSPRAAALLIGSPSGRHYLATSCHILSDPIAASLAPQQSMEPDNSENNDGLSASEAEAKPVYGMTEIAFDERAFPPRLRKNLFPAASLPHLDLSLVWLDQANTEICTALEQAGFAFVAADAVHDEPSSDGVEIRVVGSASLAGSSHCPVGTANATGHVQGLSKALSFFWIDTELAPSMSGAPVVEGEKIVGFLSPQQVKVAANLPSSFATITKAGNLKALLAAHRAFY